MSRELTRLSGTKAGIPATTVSAASAARVAVWCGVASLVALSGTMGGCEMGSSDSIESAVRQDGSRLSPADFVVAGGATSTGGAESSSSGTPAASMIVDASEQAAAIEILNVNSEKDELDRAALNVGAATSAGSDGLGVNLDPTATFATTPGTPMMSDVDSPPVGEPIFIDAKVGDINGKPIFASTFFDRGTLTLEPLGPRLREEAARLKPAEWRAFARKEINNALDSLIEDELLRAEALANLTPEQKQGFFAFLQRIEREQKSKSGGSREEANQALMESEGMSLSEYMSQRQQAELIRYQLSEKIFQRVQVSRRDIELAYTRFKDQFNPPPKYIFRIVAVPAADASAVAAMQARIDGGERFAEIAGSEANTYKRPEGGLESRDLKTDITEASFFGSAVLNDAAKAMSPGTTTGPIDFGTRKAWLHLETIEVKKTSLYDAQIMIENVLRKERADAERKRYIAKLRSRASIGDTEETARRLLEIAETRYLTPRGQ
jgi:hypothetical protein